MATSAEYVSNSTGMDHLFPAAVSIKQISKCFFWCGKVTYDCWPYYSMGKKLLSYKNLKVHVRVFVQVLILYFMPWKENYWCHNNTKYPKINSESKPAQPYKITQSYAVHEQYIFFAGWNRHIPPASSSQNQARGWRRRAVIGPPIGLRRAVIGPLYLAASCHWFNTSPGQRRIIGSVLPSLRQPINGGGSELWMDQLITTVQLTNGGGEILGNRRETKITASEK